MRHHCECNRQTLLNFHHALLMALQRQLSGKCCLITTSRADFCEGNLAQVWSSVS